MSLFGNNGIFVKDKTRNVEKVLTIAAGGFVRGDVTKEGQQGGARFVSESIATGIYANVVLPDGAVITSVESFADVDTILVSLVRWDYNYGAGIGWHLVPIGTTNTPEYVYQKGFVDNDKYIYILRVYDIDVGEKFYSAKIYYTIKEMI